MVGFLIFRNVYYNLDRKCQNKILGNIFEIDDVSASSVIVDNNKIVFKMFSCGIFYQYIFMLERGDNNTIYMDRVVQRIIFVLGENVSGVNKFVYLLSQCQEERLVYHLMKYLL